MIEKYFESEPQLFSLKCFLLPKTVVPQWFLKRPCNPNHCGLDARSFLRLKSLYVKDFMEF